MEGKETVMTKFTIGKVAAAADVGVETIRFYERRGLIAQPTPIKTSFREYPESAVNRIRFIKRAQELHGCPIIEAITDTQIHCH